MNNQLDAVTVFHVEHVGRSRSGMSRKVKIWGHTPTRTLDATEAVAVASRLRYNPVSRSISVRGAGFSVIDYLRPYIRQAVGRDVPVERI